MGARRILSGLLCAVAIACTSPTLPLPPPIAPTVSSGSTPDTVKLAAGPGGAEPNALIVIVNRNTDLPRDKRVSGTIADDQGAWDVEVTAHANDTLDISQELGTTRSQGTTIVVR
jgi:hypothetical protein